MWKKKKKIMQIANARIILETQKGNQLKFVWRIFVLYILDLNNNDTIKIDNKVYLSREYSLASLEV